MIPLKYAAWFHYILWAGIFAAMVTARLLNIVLAG